MWHPDLGDGVHPDKWASIDCPLPRIRSRMCWIGYVFTPVEIAAMAWYVASVQTWTRGFCILSGIINTIGSKTRRSDRSIRLLVDFRRDSHPCRYLTSQGSGPERRPLRLSRLRELYRMNTKGFVVLFGFLQAVYTLEGAETAAQVAEEARDADWWAPLGMPVTSPLPGSSGSSVRGTLCSPLPTLMNSTSDQLALLFPIQSVPSVKGTSFSLLSFSSTTTRPDHIAMLLTVIIMIAHKGRRAMTAWTVGGGGAVGRGQEVADAFDPASERKRGRRWTEGERRRGRRRGGEGGRSEEEGVVGEEGGAPGNVAEAREKECMLVLAWW